MHRSRGTEGGRSGGGDARPSRGRSRRRTRRGGLRGSQAQEGEHAAVLRRRRTSCRSEASPWSNDDKMAVRRMAMFLNKTSMKSSGKMMQNQIGNSCADHLPFSTPRSTQVPVRAPRHGQAVIAVAGARGEAGAAHPGAGSLSRAPR